MKITYLKTTKEDLSVIFQLCKQLIDKYEDTARIDYDKVLSWVQRKIEKCIDEYTVIYADGNKAGYYHFYQKENGEHELDDLYIFPEFQNRGIGSEVITRYCSTTDAPIKLYVFIKNERAVALYKRLGFEIVETVGESRYIMQRVSKTK